MKSEIAKVRYDSATEAARFGTRGFAAAETRTLLFHGAGLSVDVLMQDAGMIKILHGQAVRLPEGGPADGIEVVAGANETRSDRLGQFVLSMMDTHHQSFSVRTGDCELICKIPDIAVD